MLFQASLCLFRSDVVSRRSGFRRKGILLHVRMFTQGMRQVPGGTLGNAAVSQGGGNGGGAVLSFADGLPPPFPFLCLCGWPKQVPLRKILVLLWEVLTARAHPATEHNERSLRPTLPLG